MAFTLPSFAICLELQHAMLDERGESFAEHAPRAAEVGEELLEAARAVKRSLLDPASSGNSEYSRPAPASRSDQALRTSRLWVQGGHIGPRSGRGSSQITGR
jgi:hypothetical protein